MHNSFDSVNFILGYKCNSRCRHCFVRATPTNQTYLSFDLAVSYAKELAGLPYLKHVYFNGGEPFLYLDPIREITHILSKDFSRTFVISTGAGEFVTKEKTRYLLDSVGKIDELWVSIDTFHLEYFSIQNYLNLESEAQGIPIIYSISYMNLKDFTQTVLLLKKHGLVHRRIVRQPVATHGFAMKLRNVPSFISKEIPSDYKCGETTLLTIWPDGTVTNCSAYSAMSGLLDRHSTLQQAISKNSQEEFLQMRKELPLCAIAKKLNSKGPFNTVSPCSSCKSMLEKITDHRHSGLSQK